jgi:hypothetical protein
MWRTIIQFLKEACTKQGIFQIAYIAVIRAILLWPFIHRYQGIPGFWWVKRPRIAFALIAVGSSTAGSPDTARRTRSFPLSARGPYLAVVDLPGILRRGATGRHQPRQRLGQVIDRAPV